MQPSFENFEPVGDMFHDNAQIFRELDSSVAASLKSYDQSALLELLEMISDPMENRKTEWWELQSTSF